MKYRACYYNDDVGIYSKQFSTIEELKLYNKENDIENHNLHEELLLSEIVGDGLIVCVEGDEDLEDRDMSDYLKTLPNFLMLNNIYDEPHKLLQLKDKVVDVLLIQSTGIRIKEIEKLQQWYMEQSLPFPKSIVSMHLNAYEFLGKFISASPFEIKQYNHPELVEGNIMFERWIGVRAQEEGRL